MGARPGALVTLGKLRSALYRWARVLGDANAMQRGRILERLWNRIIGRLARRFMPWK